MKLLIALGLVAFIAVVQGQEEFKCVTGVPYQENECNSCFCNDSGLLGCTLMACRSHEDDRLVKCEVGKVWTKDCNTCYCVKDMGTICETKAC